MVNMFVRGQWVVGSRQQVVGQYFSFKISIFQRQLQGTGEVGTWGIDQNLSLNPQNPISPQLNQIINLLTEKQWVVGSRQQVVGQYFSFKISIFQRQLQGTGEVGTWGIDQNLSLNPQNPISPQLNQIINLLTEKQWLVGSRQQVVGSRQQFKTTQINNAHNNSRSCFSGLYWFKLGFNWWWWFNLGSTHFGLRYGS